MFHKSTQGIIAWTLVFFLRTVWSADNRAFPAYFKFGVATAAYQIEGGWHDDGKGENIWDRLTHTTPELIDDQSNGDIACDSYHKLDEDIELLKELGVDYYRFSLSWSRILPTGYPNHINQAGVDYYNRLLTKLQENNIEAMVTLFHWDTPQPLQDVGGWPNGQLAEYFAEYARLAFEIFGDKVKYWSTFNEPHVFCHQGYGTGTKAPALKAPGIGPYLCAHTVIKAHALAYHIYNDEFKARQGGKISIVLNCNWFEPASDDPKDIEAAERQLQFSIGWFANPIFNGDYPQVMIDRIKERSAKEGYGRSRLPEFTQEEINYINGTYDYLGLNHYTTNLAEWREDAEIGEPSYAKDISVRVYEDEEWEDAASVWLKVVPWGVRKITNWLKKTYNDPEIFITESGYSEKGVLDDERRINYYREYLSNVLAAILDDGVNITKYTAWSFLDNFEWFRGYTEKFGLYFVDFNSPNRTRIAKRSVFYYRDVIREKCLVNVCEPAQ